MKTEEQVKEFTKLANQYLLDTSMEQSQKLTEPKKLMA